MNTLSSLLKFIANTIGEDPSTLKTPTKNLVGGLNEAVPPIGALQMYAGSTAPQYWLICDGSAVSRTTYASLFNAIGTTYGAGDGSTTFNLPNFGGRTAIGANTTYALGAAGGEATHTLTYNEMPAHQHGSGTIGYVDGTQFGWANLQSTGSHVSWATWATAAAGAGWAHNNMQPYLAVNYIIYAGV